jgi:membrane-associated phospholipid phosphatase
MDMFIVFCAKYLIIIVGLFALSYWLTLPRKQKTEVLIMGAITGIVAFILAKIGSAMFVDPRPFVSDGVTPLFAYTADNGFPSDHTLVGMIITMALLSVSRKWAVNLFVLTIIIGASRVFAGVHHPIDIVGGILFGALGGVTAMYLTPKIINLLASSKYAKMLGLHRVTKKKK